MSMYAPVDDAYEPPYAADRQSKNAEKEKKTRVKHIGVSIKSMFEGVLVPEGPPKLSRATSAAVHAVTIESLNLNHESEVDW